MFWKKLYMYSDEISKQCILYYKLSIVMLQLHFSIVLMLKVRSRHIIEQWAQYRVNNVQQSANKNEKKSGRRRQRMYVTVQRMSLYLFLPLTEHRKLKIAFKIGNGQMPSSRIFSIKHNFRCGFILGWWQITRMCASILDGWVVKDFTIGLVVGAYAFIFYILIIHFLCIG